MVSPPNRRLDALTQRREETNQNWLTLVECVEGVEGTKVALSQGGKALATTASDGFGDFRFDNLPKGGGAYRIEASHAHGSARADCALGESVHLSELRLFRTEETADAGA